MCMLTGSTQKIICGNEEGELRCPVDQEIQVLTAMYGRPSNDHCGSQTATCPGIDVGAVIANTCNGQQKCQVTASKSSLNGGVDPCPNYNKYLEVDYICGGNRLSIVYYWRPYKLNCRIRNKIKHT